MNKNSVTEKLFGLLTEMGDLVGGTVSVLATSEVLVFRAEFNYPKGIGYQRVLHFKDGKAVREPDAIEPHDIAMDMLAAKKSYIESELNKGGNKEKEAEDALAKAIPLNAKPL